ncbi:MAG: amidohydrolase family protein, partial [Candidatus Thermoplasmatota archaeon]|nr:amidohydrolase family protein [Candidatus Thermoplasmatota archaeon]
MKQIVLQFIPFGHTEKADVVFLHGVVITVNDRFRIEEAVAIKGNRIMKVGSDREIRRLVGPGTKVINLKGRALMPGFEDSHIHFLSLASLENQIDLSEANDLRDLITMVSEKDAVTPEGSWILGRGWDQEKMKWNREYRWPTKEDLNFTDKPVFLLRV